MKKLLITLIACFGILFTNAQTEKGNWMFGGTSTFSFASNKETPEYDGEESESDYKVTTLSLATDANYFVIENLAVGMQLVYTGTKNKQDVFAGELEIKQNNLGVLPQIAYYFKSDQLAPFIGAKVGYFSRKTEYISPSTDIDYSESKFGGLAYGFEAGLAYFINKNVSVDFLVEYLHTSLVSDENDDYKIKNNTIGAGIGFNIYF